MTHAISVLSPWLKERLHWHHDTVKTIIIHTYPILYFLSYFLTSTCYIVTLMKTFHSSSGNESIITNAGVMWNRVKA